MLETFEINGAELSSDDFANLYPPVYAEAKQLPNSGIPAWVYMAHKCISCGTGINICHHNPYRVGGDLWKQKIARRAEAVVVATVDSVDGEENSNAQAGQPVRNTRQKMNKELSSDDKAAVLAAFDSGRGSTELAKEFRVYPQYMSSFLKSEGRELKKGGKKRGIRPSAEEKTLSLGDKVYILKHFDNGVGSTVLAAQLKVPQPLVSAFLKSEGRVVARGKKRKLSQAA